MFPPQDLHPTVSPFTKTGALTSSPRPCQDIITKQTGGIFLVEISNTSWGDIGGNLWIPMISA